MFSVLAHRKVTISIDVSQREYIAISLALSYQALCQRILGKSLSLARVLLPSGMIAI